MSSQRLNANVRSPSGPQLLALDRGPLHDRSYFDHGRPELLALIPETAERVLDIGCGAGRLGAAIKERQAATVIGIEIDESAAAIARTRIDDVVVGNVEILNPSFEPASFDCIVCGDILEHLTTDHRLLAPDNSCHISLT